MPYISQEVRKALTKGEDMHNPGELNYLISRHYLRLDQNLADQREQFKEKLARLLKLYVEHRGLSYQTINDVIGVLECVRLEMLYRSLYKHLFEGILLQASENFYKTVAIPYERDKLKLNGDIL